MSYALPNAWELGERRLSLRESFLDPSTFRRAEALGVGPGWRCFEAGAGHGSFARWLVERVGESGRVVAADLDVRFLVNIEGLEVRQVDIVRDELEREAFDLVHCRQFLLHIPERDALLARFAAALRPGGVLFVEEDDIYPVDAVATGAYRDGWLDFMAMMESSGLDAHWARRLPERLDALGLHDVDAELDASIFRGGSTPAESWSLSWLQVREQMLEQGRPYERVEAGRAELEDPTRWFHGPVKIMAWGRRPG